MKEVIYKPFGKGALLGKYSDSHHTFGDSYNISPVAKESEKFYRVCSL
ncbi:hypothetical protein [Thermococcus sp. PK]|nr:hypothetical protein [Thermococcus sp. PK]